MAPSLPQAFLAFIPVPAAVGRLPHGHITAAKLPRLRRLAPRQEDLVKAEAGKTTRKPASWIVFRRIATRSAPDR
jgi:hypothetical protein